MIYFAPKKSNSKPGFAGEVFFQLQIAKSCRNCWLGNQERRRNMKKNLSKLGFLLGMVIIWLILFIVIGVPLVISFWSGPPA